jgi:hypothetical protein
MTQHRKLATAMMARAQHICSTDVAFKPGTTEDEVLDIYLQLCLYSSRYTWTVAPTSTAQRTVLVVASIIGVPVLKSTLLYCREGHVESHNKSATNCIKI